MRVFLVWKLTVTLIVTEIMRRFHVWQAMRFLNTILFVDNGKGVTLVLYLRCILWFLWNYAGFGFWKFLNQGWIWNQPVVFLIVFNFPKKNNRNPIRNVWTAESTKSKYLIVSFPNPAAFWLRCKANMPKNIFNLLNLLCHSVNQCCWLLVIPDFKLMEH